MASVISDLVGLKQANAALKKLPDFAQLETQQVMDTTAFHVARKATDLAPPRSSKPRHGVHLKDAIFWKRRKFGAIVGVLKAAFHWKFWEYGTKHMAAKPMFRPAAESVRDSHKTQLEQALTRANAKMARLAPPPR